MSKAAAQKKTDMEAPEPQPQKGESELAVMFPGERKVGKYIVKPWTAKQFIEVFPSLKAIAVSMADKGADLNNLEKWFTDNLLDLGEAVLPYAMGLVTASLRVDQAEVEELPFPEFMELLTAIFTLNMEHIRDFFGRIPARM